MPVKKTMFNVTSAIPYTSGGKVKLIENCAGWIAINTGDDPAFVNDQIIYPGIPGSVSGESFSVVGNIGEIYVGFITLSFQGIGVAPEVSITQKVLIDHE